MKMKTIQSYLLFFTLGLLSCCAVFYPAHAQTRAQAQAQSGNETAKLINYLTPLIEEQLLGDTELLNFINALDKGEIINLIPHQNTGRYGVQFTKSAFQYHYDHVQLYLEMDKETPGSLDRAQLLLWAIASLKEKQRVREERAETREETQIIHQRMIFHTLEPGTFNMLTGLDDPPETVQVELTEPFDLMSTPVTQWQWSMIEGSNPSRFKDGDESIEIEIQGHAVRMRPDNPVEQVSWEVIQKFIEKLNQLSKEGDPLLKALIPDHQSGDQYRLPTDAEWSYVVQARGRSQDKYFFGNDPDQLYEYAWYDRTSEGQTHPVAQLKPLIVDGKAFYDLLGNVWEWVQDFYSEDGGYYKSSNLLKNPRGPKAGSGRVIRGCSCIDAAGYCRSAQRGCNSPGSRNPNLGFRLLRTR